MSKVLGARRFVRRLLKQRLAQRELARYLAQPGWSLVQVAGWRVIASDVRAVSAWRACAELASRVQHVLEAEGVEHWAVQPLGERVTQWGIVEEDMATVIAALARELSGQGYYLKKPDTSEPPRLIEKSELEPGDAAGDVDIVRFLKDQQGRVRRDAELCQLLSWSRSERGSLRTSNRSAVVQEIDDQRPVATVAVARWDGAMQPRPKVLAVPDASEIDFDIDAVYLWVDDSDAQWRARRDQAIATAAAEDRAIEAASLASSRFRDRGELRASMRSLEMHAPWIRQIYLVTDQQRPQWLDANSSRVRVVDHREIFADSGALPCFNSRAIGTQLHRIPGLASHYLIINDDVLFNRPASPYDFFTPEGALKIVLSRSRLPLLPESKLTTLERSRTNSARLIQRDHGERVTRLFAHAPLAQSLEIAEELGNLYESEIDQTMRHQFRSPHDFETNAWLHQYRALFTGRGVLATTPYAYVNGSSREGRRRLVSSDSLAQALFICINDASGDEFDNTEDADAWLTQWLEQAYPAPAQFECSDGVSSEDSD